MFTFLKNTVYTNEISETSEISETLLPFKSIQGSLPRIGLLPGHPYQPRHPVDLTTNDGTQYAIKTDLRDDADRVLRQNFPNSRFYETGLERKSAWWKMW